VYFEGLADYDNNIIKSSGISSGYSAKSFKLITCKLFKDSNYTVLLLPDY